MVTTGHATGLEKTIVLHKNCVKDKISYIGYIGSKLVLLLKARSNIETELNYPVLRP